MGQVQIYIFIILSTLIVFVFIIGIIIFIKQYRTKAKEYQLEKQLTAMNHQTELQQASLEMQQLTMQDIGREIHDGVGQRLTLASIYSKQLIHKNIPIESKQKLEEVSMLINESLIQLRTLSRELTNENDFKILLNEMISNEAEKIKALEVCKIEFIASEQFYIPGKSAMFIIRILQEFVQNSLKHASCSEIKIMLDSINNQMHLKLVDNGKGFNSSATYEGIGLQNMKRRAEMIKADFILESIINEGTYLEIKLDIC